MRCCRRAPRCAYRCRAARPAIMKCASCSTTAPTTAAASMSAARPARPSRIPAHAATWRWSTTATWNCANSTSGRPPSGGRRQGRIGSVPAPCRRGKPCRSGCAASPNASSTCAPSSPTRPRRSASGSTSAAPRAWPSATPACRCARPMSATAPASPCGNSTPAPWARKPGAPTAWAAPRWSPAPISGCASAHATAASTCAPSTRTSARRSCPAWTCAAANRWNWPGQAPRCPANSAACCWSTAMAGPSPRSS